MNTTEQLDHMVTGYLTAALWASTVTTVKYDREGLKVEEDVHADDLFEIDDLTPLSKMEARQDCGIMLAALDALWDTIAESEDYEGRPERFEKAAEYVSLLPEKYQQIGHDFWLTRNGHGVGFWDRGLGDFGDKLTTVAQAFPEVYVSTVTEGDTDFEPEGGSKIRIE